MLSPLDPSSAAFVYGLNQIQTREQHVQTELTSGLQISNVSDNPSEIPMLMETRSALSQAQQINTNLGQVSDEVDTGESSLQSAVTLVEQAQTLASEGDPSTTTADQRQDLADQVGSIMQQMVALANTTVGGRYIFSGDSDQTAPYSIDLTQNNAISAYAGSASTRQIQSPDGSTFSVGLTAQQIFDSSDSTTNVFQTLNGLRNALLNNDQSGIDSAITNLQGSDTYLNQQLAFYGVAQDRVSAAKNDGSTLVTQLQTRLSGIQDADMTEAITEFTQYSTQEQAALSSRAKLPTGSLFNYLS